MNPNPTSRNRSVKLPVHDTLPRILLLGLGDFGDKVAERLIQDGPIGAKCISISEERLQLETIFAHRALIGREEAKRFISEGHWAQGNTVPLSLPEMSPSMIDNDLVFITAALGREKEPALAPVLAQTARTAGSLVIGTVTIPCMHDRSDVYSAIRTLIDMRDACDAVVVVDNNRLERFAATLHETDVSEMASDLLGQLIGGIVETLSTPSLLNISFKEFADITRSTGIAIIGIGETDSSNHLEDAVRNAFDCPLLHINHGGIFGAYLHIQGDISLSSIQASRVAELVTGRLDPLSAIVFGASTNRSLSESLRVTLMLTGVKSPRLLEACSETPDQVHEMGKDLSWSSNLSDSDFYLPENA